MYVVLNCHVVLDTYYETFAPHGPPTHHNTLNQHEQVMVYVQRVQSSYGLWYIAAGIFMAVGEF